VNERVWADKSGVDKNRSNVRFDAKEFVLSCIIKADNESEAYNLANVLTNYMYEKGVFVLSLRDSVKGIRQSFLCERSNTVVPSINIREQNSLYVFNLGLKDINPNAIKYETAISGNSVTVSYDKGQNAVIYWGDGTSGVVSNSGDYIKNDYVAISGDVDVFIDIDKNADIVIPLIADFSANITSGSKDLDVTFTDASTGSVFVWSWNFGDGFTSSEQNPSHTYTEAGVYTVTLQVFNDAQGSDSEIKTGYITVTDAIMLVNDSGDFALVNDSGDLGIIN
jgi:PKD repeat protein